MCNNLAITKNAFSSCSVCKLYRRAMSKKQGLNPIDATEAVDAAWRCKWYAVDAGNMRQWGTGEMRVDRVIADTPRMGLQAAKKSNGG
jgi:hypothetical protein